MEENETKIEVLAPRCGMGAGLWVANLVALALGLGATGIGVLCLIQFLKGDGTFLFYSVFLLVLGAFAIVAETWTIFRALHSLRKGPSCLNYDEGKGEFEFFPIFGEPFKVTANCFGGILRNFFTDFAIIGFAQKDGRLRRYRLGWTPDFAKVAKRLEEIAASKK